MSAAASGPSALPLGDAAVVYLGSVSRDATEEELKALVVSKAGNPVAFERRRGYAYVQFKDAAAANKAISALNGADLKGRALVAEPSKAPAERPERPERAPKPPKDITGLPTHKDRVVVRNLPREFDSEALSKAMATVGPVVKARMTSGLGRVQFENEASAAKALELSGSNISGREIKVEYELKKERKERKAKSPTAAAGAGAAKKEAGAGRRRKADESEAEEAAPVEANPNLLWIGNLGADVTEEQVKAAVASYGKVEEVRIRSNRPRVRRGEPKPDDSTVGRSAYVTFAAESGVAAASAALEGKTGVLGAGEGGLKASAARAPRQPRRAAAAAGAGAAKKSPSAGGAKKEAAAPRAPQEPRSVRLEGLPSGATEEQVTALFASFGTIRNVKVVEDSEKGIGYVNFEAAEAAAKAAESKPTVTVNGASVGVFLTAPRIRNRRSGSDRRRSPRAGAGEA